MFYNILINTFYRTTIKGTKREKVLDMWEIKYLKIVEKWLDALTIPQYKSVAKELKLLEMCGNKLKLPHSKTLGGGLFELRKRKFGYRIYYKFEKDCVVLLLHAGDKTSQQKDIKRAKKLLKEIHL
ncbi:type II toxin-antitoxin system RelE/ParE family toxin [Cysteiniphilum sp. 6C5]|uniref:type II toxin-antitoxin system RelE/ParE family toxin n=1 Tax=unclassified Cysteiniphilum TaxID=2610889 RepID=UPI003F82E003